MSLYFEILFKVHSKSALVVWTYPNVSIFWKTFQVVKVADFGVARVCNHSGIMTAETGTYRWMAPEVCVCVYFCVYILNYFLSCWLNPNMCHISMYSFICYFRDLIKTLVFLAFTFTIYFANYCWWELRCLELCESMLVVEVLNLKY